MEQNEEQKANPKETIEENLKENTPEQGKTKEDKEIKVVEKPKEEKKIKFEDLFTRIEDEEKKEEIPKKIEVVIEEAKVIYNYFFKTNFKKIFFRQITKKYLLSFQIQ